MTNPVDQQYAAIDKAAVGHWHAQTDVIVVGGGAAGLGLVMVGRKAI